jgi:hypothetical protein
MITYTEALSLISARVDPESMVDVEGKVTLQGKWRLYELEVLCIVLRDQLGDKAVGVEETFVNAGKVESRMPLAALQSRARKCFEALVESVSATIKEDVQKLTNPGSWPVYGIPNNRGGLSFDESNLMMVTAHEAAPLVSEMTTELAALGCPKTLQYVAAAGVLSMVTNQDQADIIIDLETKAVLS